MSHELILQVLTVDGQPVTAEPIRFETLGGTIGRSPECTMVLADESRSVSRVHAHVRFSNDIFEFQQTAGNFSLVNGRTVDPLVPVALADGDRLTIGLFEVDVADSRSAERRDLLGKTNLFIKPPAAGHDLARMGDVLPAMQTPRAAGALASGPSALMGYGSSETTPGRNNGLDDFLQTRPVSSARTANLGAGSTAGGGAHLTIPDDYDFFGDDTSVSPPHIAANLPSAPFIASAPVAQNGAVGRAVSGTVAAAFVGTESAAIPAAFATPTAVPAPPPESAPTSGSAPDAIFTALLEGLGVANDARFQQLDPPTFALLAGQLLRVSLSSAIDVLRSRAIVKREAGMEATMIVARENNPLKFFPDVQAALPVMLANRIGAYLPPVQAIQEAFADIQAHELGMLAGIAASLTDQLAQLDPEDIAHAAEAPAALNRMLRNPKVAAWDLFVARHASLRTGLDESAGALSSDAFRRAYQAQVDGHLSVKASDYRAAK